MREYKDLRSFFPETDVALDKLRRHIEEHTSVHERIPPSIDLPISDECQRILFHASEEAERMGHRYIGAEHLFLGILRKQGSAVARLLHENGVSLDIVREQILKTDKTIRSTS